MLDALEAGRLVLVHAFALGPRMAQRIRGARVSPAFFDLLGARPALGRTFLGSDLPPADGPGAVIGHSLWQRVFGGDPGVVGEPLRLDGEVHVVVGVMPEGFNFPPVPAEDRTEVWTCYEPSPAADRGVGRLSLVFGRLRDGVSMEQAGRELDGIAERLAAAYPATNADVGIAIEPARFSWSNPLSTLGPPVVGASILILLLAGANVAGLLMIRQRVRREELAVRTASFCCSNAWTALPASGPLPSPIPCPWWGSPTSGGSRSRGARKRWPSARWSTSAG